jgi:Fe-S oxidoreductase
LKYEFENEYYKTNRRPLRDYMFGYFHIVAKAASFVAPLSNPMASNPFLRNMAARLLGITVERPFPKFASRRAKPSNVKSSDSGETIIFLSDPFARYIEPQVEQAAFDVLSACGYNVRVLPIVGAGASLLSKGFITAAKRHAGKVLDALNQVDPNREAVIVGVEPPELYTLKNDYPDLLPDRMDEIASVSARTWLLDEYLLRSSKFSDLRVGNTVTKDQPSRVNRKIMFQPHCHQRAEGLATDGLASGSNATLELLRNCGFDVELLHAGCCGMAGTFGYEAEHYALSMQVGELKLFPLIRGQREDKEFVIVATGAACRMQIFQGVGMSAQHPIELMRDVMRVSND